MHPPPAAASAAPDAASAVPYDTYDYRHNNATPYKYEIKVFYLPDRNLKIEYINSLKPNPNITKLFTNKNVNEKIISENDMSQIFAHLYRDPFYSRELVMALYNDICEHMSKKNIKYCVVRSDNVTNTDYYLFTLNPSELEVKFRPYRKLKQRKSVKKSRKTSKQNVSKRSRKY